MRPDNAKSSDLAELLAIDLNSYFRQLVVSFQQRIYSFVLRQTGSPQDAEDIVQETFIRAYHALADYPPERVRSMKLQPWLYKITLNIFYRSKSAQRLQCVPLDLSEESGLLEIAEEEGEQPEQLLLDKEEGRELANEVSRLPAHYRIVVCLYYYEELSYREIAETLNQPLGTVKSNVHRGMLLLRKAMQARRQSQLR